MAYDETPEQHRKSVIHLALWGIAALLLLFWLIGLGGIVHLAAWIFWIVVLFGIGFAAIGLIMWLFTR